MPEIVEKKEIQRLEELDIIEKTTGPTTRASPIVVVSKQRNPSTVRQCIDMRQANQALLRET